MYSDLHLSIIISPLRTTSPIVNHKPGPARAAPVAGQTDSPLNRSGLTQAPSVPGSRPPRHFRVKGHLHLCHTQPPSASQVCLVSRAEKEGLLLAFHLYYHLMERAELAHSVSFRIYFYPRELHCMWLSLVWWHSFVNFILNMASSSWDNPHSP